MRYYVIISYDGSNYEGYGTQLHKNTVQDNLEETLTKLNKMVFVKTFASSRTDSKVHALNQYVQFELSIDYDINVLKVKLNKILPNDIYVKEVSILPENFNVRFDVVSKTYKYVINETLNPFTRNYATNVFVELDLKKMAEASKILIGKHDFSAFCGSQSNVKDKIREIYDITFDYEIFFGQKALIIRVVGNGFLYNMVRIIVGTLVQVGMNKIHFSKVKTILESKIRAPECITFPPQALFLEKIEF